MTGEQLSTVDKLLARAEAQKKQEELTKEEFQEFKKAVNGILSSKNGKVFWKMSKKLMRIDAINNDLSPVNMAIEKAYRNYYNQIMRLADPEIRAEFSRGE